MMKRLLSVAMLLCVVIVLLSALSLKTTEAKASPSSWKLFQNRYSSTSCHWSVVPSPNGNSNSVLSGVAAVSANDVWAVGNSGDQKSGGQALIEHWNGSHWSVVKSPSPGSGGDLRDVAAVSASNVWAVGYSSIGGSIQTLVERWNGTGWQVVKSPGVATIPTFTAVAAVSAHDVWAVGSYHNSNSNAIFQTLTEQWNGQQWSVVKSPSPGSFNTQLLGVAAVSPTNAWAVGVADSNTLTEHFHC
jgi:hypothetical protein